MKARVAGETLARILDDAAARGQSGKLAWLSARWLRRSEACDGAWRYAAWAARARTDAVIRRKAGHAYAALAHERESERCVAEFAALRG